MADAASAEGFNAVEVPGEIGSRPQTGQRKSGVPCCPEELAALRPEAQEGMHLIDKRKDRA